MAPIMTRFLEAFRQFDATLLERLDTLYADTVVFQDPVCTVEGREALRRYFADMCAGLEHCTFSFERVLTGPQQAALEWTMHLSHRRLERGRLVHVPGVSWLAFTDRIHHHRDHYDLGALVYERVPLLGDVIGHVKRRLEVR